LHLAQTLERMVEIGSNIDGKTVANYTVFLAELARSNALEK
jgi:hypothetical protein